MNYAAHRLLVSGSYLTGHHLVFRTDDLVERAALASEIESNMRVASGSTGWRNTTWAYEWYLLYEGRWQELRTLIENSEPPALAVFWSTAMCARALLAWRQGRGDDARGILDRMIPHGPDDGSEVLMSFRQREAHRLTAMIAIEDRDFDRARRYLRSHDDWIATSGALVGRADGFLAWAELLRAEGDLDAAFPLARQSLEQASDPYQPVALIAAHRVLGQLETGNQSLDAASVHLQQALRLADACALPYERALAMLSQAELEIARDRPRAAATLLNEVTSICTTLGATPALERVSSIRSRGAVGSCTAGTDLSPRELDVLRLVAQGLSDKDIACQLFISPRTVMHHVSSILRKFDVESRTAAAARAMRDNVV
jgi:ATP/maltotriose-dependent transcriptional regulator MalT